MAANKYGMVPAAGHGLSFLNAGPVAGIRYMEEMYFGRTLASRALVVGLNQAITDMDTLIYRNRNLG
jgi:pyridoxine 5'-phosphate synthase PdxJ